MSALDASTGEKLWSAGYPAPYTPSSPTAAHGSGPKATPAFHDSKLFTLGISGVVAAFDASNAQLLWRTAAPSEPPFFSAASSPVAEDGVVFVHPGNYGPLTAFDADTGEVERRRRGVLRVADYRDARGNPPDHLSDPGERDWRFPL